MNVREIKQQLPQYVLDIARILEKEGFQAFLVGGSVRDLIMGRIPHDYDIGTDAFPDDMVRIFPKAITTGAKFGAVIVLISDKQGEKHPIDVTTFRIEEQYVAGRWPSVVEFTRNIKDDLARRDFTINAMAINLAKLEREEEDIVLDPFDGRTDIEKKCIRAVGDPRERLKEDALRALRACRLASVLGFTVDQELLDAIPGILTMIDNLSAERVRDEVLKIIYDSPKPSVGVKLLQKTKILDVWIPELLEGIGVEQPEYHKYDVYEHSLRTLDMADDQVKLAALFHDIGKPRTHEDGHFYRHDIVGAEMTREILKRLRFSNKEIEKVCTLVRWHMFYFPYDEDDFMKGKLKDERRLPSVSKWKDAAIRRFVKNVGGEDAIDDLIRLRIADATANPMSSFNEAEIRALQARIAEVRQKDMALKVTDLDINGKDLEKLGIRPGPKMGQILYDLLELVIEDPVLNDKKTLSNIVKKNYLT